MMQRTTQGRCRRCGFGVIWLGRPRLRDARCPECYGDLKQTTALAKIQWLPARRRERGSPALCEIGSAVYTIDEAREKIIGYAELGEAVHRMKQRDKRSKAWRPGGGGRPPAHASGAKREVNIRLSPQGLERVDELATLDHTSRSQEIEQLIDRSYTRRGGC